MIRLLLCLAIAAPAAADPPPKLMAMFVHDGGARAAAVRTALRDSGLSWIGCRTVAGQTDRAVTFAFFRDHAQIASLKPVLNAIPNVRSFIFAFSSAMSYNAERIPFSEAKAFGVSLWYVRRGTTDAYVAEQKLAADLLRKAAIKDEEFVAYSLEFGGEVPAFLFLTPMRSLGDLDVDLSAAHENLFTEEQDRHRAAVLERAVRSNESMLLVVDGTATPRR
jgi:hypothetical protein